jgi:quinolinate synthase
MKDWFEIKNKLIFEDCYSGEQIEHNIQLMHQIEELAEEKNAALFVHYYQSTPIRLLADVLADSLRLARAGKEFRDKDIILSSTVYFMAEMIKILNPEQKVLIPDLTAGCSIASGMNSPTVRRIREAFPNAKIVTYINTLADVKAESDVICTSANAAEIMTRIGGYQRIMIPDYFLAKNTVASIPRSELAGRKFFAYKAIEDSHILIEDLVKERVYRISADDIILPELPKGTCEVHELFTAEEVMKEKLKGNKILAHPEVNPSVARIADMIGGTGRMLDFVSKDDAKDYFIVSECDYARELALRFPEKRFNSSCKLCPYMKKNTLEKLLTSLQQEIYEVNVDDVIAARAKIALERMFELT